MEGPPPIRLCQHPGDASEGATLGPWHGFSFGQVISPHELHRACNAAHAGEIDDERERSEMQDGRPARLSTFSQTCACQLRAVFRFSALSSIRTIHGIMETLSHRTELVGNLHYSTAPGGHHDRSSQVRVDKWS